jgi:hypothetical protein
MSVNASQQLVTIGVVGSVSRQLITCARQQHLGDDPGPSCLVGRPCSPGGVTIEVLVEGYVFTKVLVFLEAGV